VERKCNGRVRSRRGEIRVGRRIFVKKEFGEREEESVKAAELRKLSREEKQ